MRLAIPRTKSSILTFLGCLYIACMFGLILWTIVGCAKPVVWAEGTPEHGDTVVNGVKK